MKKFSELEYIRPDIDKLVKQIDAAISRIKNARSYQEMKEGFFAIQKNDIEFETMYVIAMVRNTVNLNDEFYASEIKWLSEASASLIPKEIEVSDAMLSSPYREDFTKEFGGLIFKGYEAQKKTKSERIIPQTVRIDELRQEYSKVTASCVCDFRGEKCNFYGLLKHMQSTDRAERREAFEKWASLYESISDKLDEIYTELVSLRVDIAKTMGFETFTDYAYLTRGRYDYTPSDIERFRGYVEKYITPYCAEFYEKQAEVLGVDKIRFYDESLVFADGNPTPKGTKDELVSHANRMYHELSKETGEFFDFMCEYELFDLETKVGKRMGGYCTALGEYKAPFIFSNFNGTSADVDVLTHEAGHAFEMYTASRVQSIADYVGSTSEINEIHSMSMEFFTHPWMEFFFGDGADKYRYAHTFDALETIPYLVSVDEYQHRIFENPTMSAKERRKIWHDIEKKYMPWRDYDGNAFLEEGGFWMQKQHIFLYPFYYVDYALAQMCAFSYFTDSLTDRKKAFEGYLNLCRAGGSKGYFELLEGADLPNPFVEENVKSIIGKVIAEIESLKSKI